MVLSSAACTRGTVIAAIAVPAAVPLAARNLRREALPVERLMDRSSRFMATVSGG
jgi:hypothetical protein